MKYGLRSLLIAAMALSPIAAHTLTLLQTDWSDELLLAIAILSAIPYAVGIGMLIFRNSRVWQSWAIAVLALIAWPTLFLMGVTQLLVAIPIWTVILVDGGNMERPLSRKAIVLTFAITFTLMAWLSVVAVLHR